MALLLDISVAFDNVWWPVVLKSLRVRDFPRNVFEVMKNYFSDRNVVVGVGSSNFSKQTTWGFPQGSVLGPEAVRYSKANMASRPPTILVEQQSIKFRNEVRYLGVHFGYQMSAHCSHLVNKEKLFGKPARSAGSRCGLGYGALSTIYCGVFTPIVEYAAPGWADFCTEADV